MNTHRLLALCMAVAAVVQSAAAAEGDVIFTQLDAAGVPRKLTINGDPVTLDITTGALKQDILVGSGRSITASGGGVITATGVVSGGVTTAAIEGNAVDNARLATMGANTVKGRLSTSGTAQDISLSSLLTAIGAQPLDSDLTDYAADSTAFGRSLTELSNAAALRTAAEVGATRSAISVTADDSSAPALVAGVRHYTTRLAVGTNELTYSYSLPEDPGAGDEWRILISFAAHANTRLIYIADANSATAIASFDSDELGGSTGSAWATFIPDGAGGWEVFAKGWND